MSYIPLPIKSVRSAFQDRSELGYIIHRIQRHAAETGELYSWMRVDEGSGSFFLADEERRRVAIVPVKKGREHEGALLAQRINYRLNNRMEVLPDDVTRLFRMLTRR